MGSRHSNLRKKGTQSSDNSEHKSSESFRDEETKEISMANGSEEYLDIFCNPCKKGRNRIEAQGFCNYCKEYLCGTCYKSHSRSKASQHHVLLDKDNMPKIAKLCGPCKRADDKEEAAGYCTECGEYLCSNCLRSHSGSNASSHHVLLDKDNMPEWPGSAHTVSIVKMNVNTPGTDSQKYNEEYTYIRDINVKTEKDETDCLITDITLVSSTALVLADYNNKSLKLVDLVNNVIIDSLRFETVPGGLTTISQDQVALVLQNKRNTCIKIISVSEGLSVVRSFNTKGKCKDVQFANGNLYFSFSQPLQFQIRKVTADIQETIKSDSHVLKYCTFPRYIAVSPDVIYISDWKTNRVMCIDMNGNMISLFQGELDEPEDITISPFGSVYLCNKKQHVVYKMTSDLSEAAVILGQGDGLCAPHAMCFNTDKQQLYISSESPKAKNYL